MISVETVDQVLHALRVLSESLIRKVLKPIRFSPIRNANNFHTGVLMCSNYQFIDWSQIVGLSFSKLSHPLELSVVTLLLLVLASPSSSSWDPCFVSNNRISRNASWDNCRWCHTLRIEPAPWMPQVNMTLTWTHSALKPPGAKNCLDILKRVANHDRSWKRVFNFMRNPKLAHILV